MKKASYILAATMLLCMACGGDKQQAANDLLEQANSAYEQGHYNEALLAIDSLRKTYPSAIDIRKKALKLYQDVSLKQAQEELADVDTLLQQAKARYDAALNDLQTSQRVQNDAARLEQEVTAARLHRDSLQIKFDVLCEKIKYIHKKQKED